MRRKTFDGHLPPVQFFLLMLSVFNVFIGYGIALPILPFLLESRFSGQAAFSTAWHTGMMTGVFMFTLFLFAPLWGKVSDRIGRRPVILTGLGACVISLLAFGLVEKLWLAYLIRALDGAVVSAVLPVALAYIGDTSSSEVRAHRFAWMSAAATLGFLIGPVFGGWLSGSMFSMSVSGIDASSIPFLASAAGGSLVWIAVYLGLSEPSVKLSVPSKMQTLPVTHVNPHTQVIPLERLFLLTSLGMFGLGSFEVSIALQGQQNLNLGPFQIGVLFMFCSLMMVMVQVLFFTSFVRYLSFKHVTVTALLIMAVGVAMVPVSANFTYIILAVGLVGLGSGALIPMLAYQTSLIAGPLQGATLGKQTAAGSLGQGIGSVLAGGLFSIVSQAPFWFTAGLLTVGVLFGFRTGRKRANG